MNSKRNTVNLTSVTYVKKKFIYDKKNKYYKNFMKVRDHDQYTGIYRGAAPSICNWRYTRQEDIPVVNRNGCN